MEKCYNCGANMDERVVDCDDGPLMIHNLCLHCGFGEFTIKYYHDASRNLLTAKGNYATMEEKRK